MKALLALAAAAALTSPAPAVNVALDYTFDTTNFFGAGNPSGPAAGAQARAALEAAADFLSVALTDTLSPISTPAPFVSSVFDGVFTWTWSLNFDHPVTGADVVLTNPGIPGDDFRVYAGAGALGGSTLGFGGPGGWSFSASGTGGFTQAEVNQINATTATFRSQVERRGEQVGDFAAWGGAIRFDSDGSTLWHYDHLAPVPSGRSDFFSVALHELVHALGFGSSAEWNSLRSGSTFSGAASRAAFGGVNPPLSPDGDHWSEGTRSTLYGGAGSQEASLDPTLTSGARKLLTVLDLAGLDDIGWDVAPPVVALPGDYNGDSVVDAADYTVWRDNLGSASPVGTFSEWRTNYARTAGSAATAAGVPEPSSLAAAAAAAACWLRRRR